MKMYVMVAVLAAALAAPAALASDDDDHFEGLPAQTLDEALINLRTSLPVLKTTLEGELDAVSMNAIHELTYTLESAMERVRLEVVALQTELEALHLASEQWEADAVRSHGAAFSHGASRLAGGEQVSGDETEGEPQ
ncbi:MAG: hypothetical protein GC187_00870 [Alphaproteobacteria bacterium]|nr:hypothetical protein [Alphaproteobacteria bacterium]